MDTKELLTQNALNLNKTIKLFKADFFTVFFQRCCLFAPISSKCMTKPCQGNEAKYSVLFGISSVQFAPGLPAAYVDVSSSHLSVTYKTRWKPPQGRGPANSIRQASASDPDISSQWTPWKMADWSPLPPWRLGPWLIRHWFDLKWERRALSCALNKEAWTRFPLSNCRCHEVTLAVNNRGLQLYGNRAQIQNTLACMSHDRRMRSFENYTVANIWVVNLYRHEQIWRNIPMTRANLSKACCVIYLNILFL